MKSERGVVATAVACHFVASFAALGIPPYFPIILETSLHSHQTSLAGIFYVVPTTLVAITSPLWGSLADRFGKKPMLLRAQFGLALSFLLAAYASSTVTFFAALVLQGIVGGTFSATNAYLATVTRGRSLVSGLTAMQASARSALVLAPIVVGALLDTANPIAIYRPLALLPLLAAIIVWRLPESSEPAAAPKKASQANELPVLDARQIYWLQAIFVFATVVTFPYFVPLVRDMVSGGSRLTSGALFGLPHLVYIVASAPLMPYFASRGTGALSAAFGLLAASLLAQAHAGSVVPLVAARLLMGVAMTASFIVFHAQIARVVGREGAGRAFGWFESSSKWGAVAAGVAAGFAVQTFGLRCPFYLGALAMGGAATYLLVVAPRGQRIASLEEP